MHTIKHWLSPKKCTNHIKPHQKTSNRTNINPFQSNQTGIKSHKIIQNQITQITTSNNSFKHNYKLWNIMKNNSFDNWFNTRSNLSRIHWIFKSNYSCFLFCSTTCRTFCWCFSFLGIALTSALSLMPCDVQSLTTFMAWTLTAVAWYAELTGKLATYSVMNSGLDAVHERWTMNLAQQNLPELLRGWHQLETLACHIQYQNGCLGWIARSLVWLLANYQP